MAIRRSNVSNWMSYEGKVLRLNASDGSSCIRQITLRNGRRVRCRTSVSVCSYAVTAYSLQGLGVRSRAGCSTASEHGPTHMTTDA